MNHIWAVYKNIYSSIRFYKIETFDLINRKITMNEFLPEFAKQNILCISENEKLIKLILTQTASILLSCIILNSEKLFLKYIETNLEPEIIKIENLAVVST